ncbi:hypothetical protein LZT24_16485 [Aeromonas veronii]|uniref:hypothetical protein n=1 Tax=Aeromonas veronii TaxID=654 RepID=UPI0021E73833|nr:hypothetical protein [Aeromonas veronii]MCV3285664.1 hypothetical protein [Aeromonas veronii]
MKIRNLVKFAPAAVAVALSSGSANAAGSIDFSAITGFVDGATVLAGVAAVVGIQIAPTAGKWAFRKVMAMFGR